MDDSTDNHKTSFKASEHCNRLAGFKLQVGNSSNGIHSVNYKKHCNNEKTGVTLFTSFTRDKTTDT
jgi:hypothetical protein